MLIVTPDDERPDTKSSTRLGGADGHSIMFSTSEVLVIIRDRFFWV